MKKKDEKNAVIPENEAPKEPAKKEKKPRKEAPLIVQTIVLVLVLAAAVICAVKVTSTLDKERFKNDLTSESEDNLASYRGTYKLSESSTEALNSENETVKGMLDYFGDTITVTDKAFEIAGTTCAFADCQYCITDQINSLFLANSIREFSYESLVDADGNKLTYPVTLETGGLILGADYRFIHLVYGNVTLTYSIVTE